MRVPSLALAPALALCACVTEPRTAIEAAPVTVEPAPVASSEVVASPPLASSPAPSTPQVPTAAPEPEPEPEPEPKPLPAPSASAPSPPAALEGTISSRSGSVLHLALPGVAPSTVGSKARLYRRFSRTLGSIDITGWLEIADVIVKKADSRGVVVEIVKEKSDIRVNGSKLDHFAVGQIVKLEP